MLARNLIGIVLWRGGLLLAGSWSAFRVARWLLQRFELPTPIEVGLSLITAGIVLVMASIVLENRDDRKEPAA